jgi:cation transporter-like permease
VCVEKKASVDIAATYKYQPQHCLIIITMDSSNPPPKQDEQEEDDRKMPAIIMQQGGGGTNVHAVPPPLSSTGAAGTEDEDEDDDDDWSRRVEMDETVILQGNHNLLLDEDSSFRIVESSSVHAGPEPQQHHHAQSSSSEAAAASARHQQALQAQQAPLPPPTQPELTMKERLVLRERQRRIETERARLKRQFALSLHPPDEDNDTETTSRSGGDHQEGNRGGVPINIGDLLNGAAVDAMESASSVAGTLGEESTMVHPDEESAAALAQEQRLGFNMERFLRNNDAASSFNPEQLAASTNELLSNTAPIGTAAVEQHQPGVVMERFLNDPVVVMETVPLGPSAVDSASSGGGGGGSGANMGGEASTSTPNHVHRTVSFEAEVRRHHSDVAGTDPTENSNSMAVAVDGSLYGLDTDMSMDANVSVQAQADDDVDVATMGDEHDPLRGALPIVGDAAGSSVVSDDRGDDDHHRPTTTINTAEEGSDVPRVLRLTEADMQEMAATEEASIANAPPSERDDNLSEVGELADFGSSGLAHHARHHGGSFSQDTPTTAMESASSVISGRSGEKLASHDAGSDDGHTGSILEDDVSANDDTVAANPPSLKGDAEVAAMPDSHPETPEMQEVKPGPALPMDVDNMASAHAGGDSSQELEIANRRIRPGMLGLHQHPTAAASLKDPPPNSVAAANAMTPKASAVFVDDFEYDKDVHDEVPQSPRSPDADANNDSYCNLPDDVVDNDVDEGGGHSWSPEGKMHVSPIHTRPRLVLPHGGIGGIENRPILPESASLGVIGNGGGGYGSVEGVSQLSRMSDLPTKGISESVPLLSDVPPEIITTRDTQSERASGGSNRRSTRLASLLHRPRRLSVSSMVDAVFSDVRSEEECEKEETHNESAMYKESSAFARAMPERLLALTATLCLEVPVLLMISGGSDALCSLIGRTKYQLLVGFLPLTSAISGNVGLQSSTLTTRAVSHHHVTTNDFMAWFRSEICAAFYLGISMGLILGTMAFFMSGMDFAFGLTIMIAQVSSIVTAGCTGTLAPLFFSFILGRDAGKWGGPMETAIQDIVGSFAMVIMSYYLLKVLGAHPVAPDDVCGGALEIQV